MSRIPDPDLTRPPMKVNLFEAMRGANCTLIPLFPWLQPGAMVPAGTLFVGGAATHFGFFQHKNDMDEIFLCFASKGSRIRAGSVRVGPREHFVGSPFLEDAPAGSFALVAIVQRQADRGAQSEEVVFQCVKCHAELLRRSFDATPGTGDVFTTLEESLATYRLFNEKHRTCPKCGLENPAFPISLWGQDAYVERAAILREARAMLENGGPGGGSAPRENAKREKGGR